MGEFGAVSVVSGSIMGKTTTLPLFVEQTYKNYETATAFSAALLLAFLAGLTLLFKEILERKTAHKSI
jgi:sulfate transport system permease protein